MESKSIEMLLEEEKKEIEEKKGETEYHMNSKAESLYRFIENSVAKENISSVKWIDEVEPTPISEFEKNLLKDSKSVTTLLEEEKRELEEKKEETEEEKLKRERRDFITKVKVIAIDGIGKFPLDNPSTFTTREKKKLISSMESLIKLPEEDITKMFNSICTDVVFASESDYVKYAIYK